MEPKTGYSVVGFVVIGLVAGLIIVSLWLSVGFDQKKYKIYATYFRESVGGITEESPVKFNGVKVGSVLKIQLSPSDPQQVMILLSIENDTPITTSTVASIVSQGITGVSYLGLSANSADLTLLKTLPGEPYPIIPTKSSLFNQLDRVVREVSDKLNITADRLNSLLNDENRRNIRKTLKNISISTQQLPKAVKDFNLAMNKLGKMAGDVSEAGKKFGDTMDTGKAAIKTITQQTLPPANLLLKRLNEIAANLQSVSSSLRQNPSVLIRGSTPPKSGPGE